MEGGDRDTKGRMQLRRHSNISSLNDAEALPSFVRLVHPFSSTRLLLERASAL